MKDRVSRRKFLGTASAAAVMPQLWASRQAVPFHAFLPEQAAPHVYPTRIVDMHVHFDEKKANFISDLLKLSEPQNSIPDRLFPSASLTSTLRTWSSRQKSCMPWATEASAKWNL